jgi:Obg family GTPase CgtA
MRFVDEVRIRVEAGDGGNGCAAFRREKHVPRGGPAGGDGGRGGDVTFVADGQIVTLLDLRYQRIYRADRGEDGRGGDQYGKNGEDCIIPVPVGTLVFDAETDDVLVDLNEAGMRWRVAKGGKGGFGNIHFKSSTRQAPDYAYTGRPGDKRDLRLELKLLAEAGLIGFPNVGKSTLIATVSKAKPKIADYPFTTLVPNLGVVSVEAYRSFVMADIPGLIPGASQGLGLGIQFLRHVERCRVLVHLIEVPPNYDDPAVQDAEKKALTKLRRKKVEQVETRTRREFLRAVAEQAEIGAHGDEDHDGWDEDERPQLSEETLNLWRTMPRGPMLDYEVIRRELQAYAPDMADKPEIVVLSKADLDWTSAAVTKIRKHFEKKGLEFFVVSSVTGEGTVPLIRRMYQLIEKARAAEAPKPAPKHKDDDQPKWSPLDNL